MVTFTFDEGIEANVTEIELIRRDGVTDPIKVKGLLEKACFTSEGTVFCYFLFLWIYHTYNSAIFHP